MQKFIDKEKNKFKKLNKKIFTLSLFDDKIIKDFKDDLVKILKIMNKYYFTIGLEIHAELKQKLRCFVVVKMILMKKNQI